MYIATGIELVSVHIPKCAGKSFSTVLQGIYGESLMRDQRDQPLDPERPFQKDFAAWKAEQDRQAAPPGARAIHGHFWAGKYDYQAPNATRIIWLRHPVQRLVSHYHYWKNIPLMPHSLHRLLREHNLSLLEFARLPVMQNIVRNTFLRDRTLDEFAFVGLQECFAEDLRWLTRRMKWKEQKVPRQNRTAYNGGGANTLDSATERQLRALNEADIELYNTALQLRARRRVSPRLWLAPARSARTLTLRPRAS